MKQFKISFQIWTAQTFGTQISAVSKQGFDWRFNEINTSEEITAQYVSMYQSYWLNYMNYSYFLK